MSYRPKWTKYKPSLSVTLKFCLLFFFSPFKSLSQKVPYNLFFFLNKTTSFIVVIFTINSTFYTKDDKYCVRYNNKYTDLLYQHCMQILLTHNAQFKIDSIEILWFTSLHDGKVLKSDRTGSRAVWLVLFNVFGSQTAKASVCAYVENMLFDLFSSSSY